MSDKALSISGSPMKRSSDLPVLFISHRYSDSSIADALRYFLATRSGGQIRIAQSSPATSRSAEVPQDASRRGSLNRDDLLAAQAVILIYTGTEEDWAYCMWECGVATNPGKATQPALRVLAFAEFPLVVTDEPAVNVRSVSEVRKFVDEFLISPNFIPTLARPLAPALVGDDATLDLLTQELLKVFESVDAHAPAAPPLKVFLCHSSADKPRVRELAKRLRADGFAPWLDEEALLPGQDWNDAIQRAVREADCVLVCISRDATTRRGYLQREIREVLDVADEVPDGRVYVIPARLEDCDVPERLRRWQWADLFKDEGYPRILRTLVEEKRVRG